MVENKSQFYLCDRWYYLINETENKLVYSSKPKSKTDGNRIEIDKENNKINIIYLSNKKTLGKLEININDNQTRFHYSQYECNEICVNSEIYANLIFELFTIKNQRGVAEKTEIMFIKKRKLNKMCYREPDFPMNKRIQIQDIDFDVKEIKAFQEIVDHSIVYIKKILKLIEEPIKNNETETIEKVKKLEVPETLQVYDRSYTFVRLEDQKLLYENSSYGVTNLEIRIDTTDMRVLGIKFVSKGKNNEKPPKHIIEISLNKMNCITARYHNCRKTDVYINNEKIEQARIKSELVFDFDNKNTESKIKIESKNRNYDLVVCPIGSSLYQDEETNLYKVYCNDYVDFKSMISYIPGIYNHVQNNIFKEKELMKK